MRSTKDRIRQALSFEIIGLIIVTPLFAWLFSHPSVCLTPNLTFKKNVQ